MTLIRTACDMVLKLAADDKTNAALRVACGAFLISFSSVFVKLAHVSPTVSAFYRTFIGGVLLFLIVFLNGEKLWKGLLSFLLAGACGVIFFLDLYVWHRSIHAIGPGLATILANFQVFLLALFGVLFLGERLQLKMVVAIPMALCGLFMLAGVHWNQLEQAYRTGLYLGITTAVCYAAYLLVLRKLQSLANAPSAMVNLTILSLVAALLLGLTAGYAKDSFAIPDFQSLLALAGLGCISQVLGWILIAKGLPFLRSSLTGLLLLLQPALSFTWDILFFGRPTGIFGVLGAVLSLTAIYLGTTLKKSTRKSG